MATYVIVIFADTKAQAERETEGRNKNFRILWMLFSFASPFSSLPSSLQICCGARKVTTIWGKGYEGLGEGGQAGQTLC